MRYGVVQKTKSNHKKFKYEIVKQGGTNEFI